jgi:glycosyltransferase involved in cell wall biosynthesis
MDLHNVYSTVVRRAAEERGALSHWYLRREARLLEKMERRAVYLADALLTVSEQEAAYFSALGANNVQVVANGVDCQAYADLPLGRSGSTPVLLYVGPMSWEPNFRAVQFLATEVMPKVRARFPEARLRVVGSNPSPAALALNRLPGVDILGAVPAMTPHLLDAHVLAVPLESGGGTRLKILEALAAGLPVVSTPVGCEGLRVTCGEHLLVANRDRFAERLCSLLADPALGRQLAANARALARRQYDWGALSVRACEAVAGVLAKQGARVEVAQ